MPVTYKIDANKKTVRTKCVGLVTLQEVVDHFRILEQDPDCPDILDVFLDLSEMDSLPETREISSVVNEMKRIRGQVRFGACAILATRDSLIGMMRVFEAMAEDIQLRSRFHILNIGVAKIRGVSQGGKRRQCDPHHN